MEKAERIEYKGRVYERRQGKWVDKDCTVVHEALQRTLNKLHLETLDISDYGIEDLIAEGDRLKESSSYIAAIKFYEQVVHICNERTLAYVLPRITSCYRHCHMAGKAVELFSMARKQYGDDFMSPVLLTSVAAAYCDMKEYEKAMRCCRWAFKRYDGKADPNLRNVYLRIKKESGLD